MPALCEWPVASARIPGYIRVALVPAPRPATERAIEDGDAESKSSSPMCQLWRPFTVRGYTAGSVNGFTIAAYGAPIVQMPTTEACAWSVAKKNGIVEVGFGSGSDFPQYAALHSGSGFLRLNSGRNSGWGTSIVTLPCFWEAGRYFQGAEISVAWRTDNAELVLSFDGMISRLRAHGEIRLSPPVANQISCIVLVSSDCRVNLDFRPGEAFKLVALSSMHLSAQQWDASLVEIGSKSLPIPERGWIIQPPLFATGFALRGGTSMWKRRAPSIRVELDTSLAITGWKTASSNPDDDNLALWAATHRVPESWRYTVTASAEDDTIVQRRDGSVEKVSHPNSDRATVEDK